MEWTLVDWQKIFEDEASDRTAVIATAQRAHFLRDIHLADDFKRYGEVETSRYERHNGYHYAIIQFKEAASATNLLGKRSIVLLGVDFIVLPFHSIDKLIKNIQNMNFTHPSHHVAPENSDGNIVNALNDDCLSEIFGRIHSLSDLTAISNVCTRFKHIAETAFNPLLKRKQIDFSELKGGGSVTLIDIEKFLRRFGSAIVSVLLCEDDFPNELDVVNPVLKLMQRHCPNLNSFTLHKDFKFEELKNQTVIEIRPLLAKLSHVEICYKSRYSSPSNSYIELISACTDVETLIVNINFSGHNLPEINFSKLKVFQTDCMFIKLAGFLAQNRQIEELNVPCESGMGRLISERIPAIRKIIFPEAINDSDVVHLKSLKQANISMQWIDIDANIRVIFEMKNVTSLRFKLFRSFDYEVLLELTKHLWNLQNLAFYYGGRCRQLLSIDMLKQMLQYTKALTKLKIRWPKNYVHHFYENGYNEILQVVKSRTNPHKLNIVLDTITERCDGEHGIKTIFLNVHPQWLTITTRYQYLTRKANSSHDKFERQSEKLMEIRTHVLVSAMPSINVIPSKQQKIKFNVL